MVKVGSFEKGDSVNVVHGGQTLPAYITSSSKSELNSTLEEMAEGLCLFDNHSSLIEGYPGKLILDPSITELSPGDIIGKA